MSSRFFFLAATLLLALSAVAAADRPNILWITSEDNSPYLGCYGDRLALTPHLDGLAAQGVRYRNAFANAPVCSTARTTLITGMYASSLGAEHHRSRVEIPGQFKLYPEHLRAAGYYCSNNSKEDYNLTGKRTIWDESSRQAHYRNRAPGQPFFAVFNFTTSHESRVAPKPGKTSFRVPPEEIALPPYHPDTPEIRRDWANYYDQMTLMDAQVGEVLAGLEKEGLAGDTIVFYYGDHGGALPRGKRNIHDSGTRVPLIIRFPAKWAHLAPARPGEWVDELVSFVDLPPTLFSLCGVEIPGHYEGRPFLGEMKAAPREHVFLFRGRMDERYDTVRAVRDREFRYVRNYSPHRPWGQHYGYPFQVLPGMRSWHAEFAAGRCNEVQSAYWQRKPGEEFYQVLAPGHPDGDPFEVRNRIAEPQHAARIASLRAALRAEILATRDAGFIPEGMSRKLAGDKTVYDYAQSDAYPLERILDLADQASDRNPAHLPDFIAALDDAHPVIRYWAAMGCLILEETLPKVITARGKARLRARLDDDWADVRVVAAEALAHLGETEAAVKAVAGAIKSENPHEALAAQNTLDYLRQAGRVTPAEARELVRGLKFSEPGDRIPRQLLDQAKPNVLFIISDDLTLTALSSYGNTICQTPNIDRLAAQGTRFTRAYCNATYCGPSRASFMSGYYPHATGVLGYTSPRPAIGDRATWAQHFKNAGYHTARISKVYHMGVPGGIVEGGDGRDHSGGDGADDPASWTEKFNSPGPEWKAPGIGETLEGNPDGSKPVLGGNRFVVVEADGDDLVHSDGKTAARAVELIERYAREQTTAKRGEAQPFFLAVGFVRPHVPFVAPKSYFEPFKPYDKLPLPPKREGAWDHTPKAGINYKTSVNMKMDVRRQKKAVGGYYASVAYLDAQVGKVLDALRKSGLDDNTIVIFTSDHGYHLGEHDFWAKVSLRDESAMVPLIIRVPGKEPAVCHSLVELIDLYPTTARLCGLEAQDRLQGKDISRMFDDPEHTVRDAAFSVAPMRNGFLLREERWAYLQYGEDASQGIELFDMENDPKQYTNLAAKPEFAAVVNRLKTKLASMLQSVRDNDLGGQ